MAATIVAATPKYFVIFIPWTAAGEPGVASSNKHGKSKPTSRTSKRTQSNRPQVGSTTFPREADYLASAYGRVPSRCKRHGTEALRCSGALVPRPGNAAWFRASSLRPNGSLSAGVGSKDPKRDASISDNLYDTKVANLEDRSESS